ncbi:hypothetical protein GSI_05124 [Ganoderma sinense ZZ0214-1]|uniref:Uncharacterized protein n=1 Tax=Ganoderma sinense ZZ0214-1 TaxID=1077348 RepID=A0A2G8SF86_9APHY|nr:hypothetical protein GSI_05124 [Ganoderma sinense ZZ0214-1]
MSGLAPWDPLSATLVSTHPLPDKKTVPSQSTGETPSLLRVLLTQIEKLTGRVTALEEQQAYWESQHKILLQDVEGFKRKIVELEEQNAGLAQAFEDMSGGSGEMEQGALIELYGDQTQQDIYNLL